MFINEYTTEAEAQAHAWDMLTKGYIVRMEKQMRFWVVDSCKSPYAFLSEKDVDILDKAKRAAREGKATK